MGGSGTISNWGEKRDASNCRSALHNHGTDRPPGGLRQFGFALRHDNHLLDLKLGYQHIPYQGYPNQRMDMTDNTRTQVNVGYTGKYEWCKLDARVYREHTEHEMNFLEDKAFWYLGPMQTIPAPGMPMLTEGKNTGAVVKGDIALSARDLLRVGGEIQQYRLDDYWPASGNGGMSPNTFLNINNGERAELRPRRNNRRHRRQFLQHPAAQRDAIADATSRLERERVVRPGAQPFRAWVARSMPA